MVYQDITRNSSIPAAAKGLYAYLASFCGASDECYPSVETITREMGIGRDTFYRHINILVAAGVVEKRQAVNNGKFGNTVYRLTHNIVISDFPNTQNEDTINEHAINETTVFEDTNNNNINNNNINNNNVKNNSIDIIESKDSIRQTESVRQVVEAWNKLETYGITPVSKISNTSKRYKSLNARIKEYGLEKVLQAIENIKSSKFLQGKTESRKPWVITFDWFVLPNNFPKVLEGNYADREVQEDTSSETPYEDDATKLYRMFYGDKPYVPRPDDPFQ